MNTHIPNQSSRIPRYASVIPAFTCVYIGMTRAWAHTYPQECKSRATGSRGAPRMGDIPIPVDC